MEIIFPEEGYAVSIDNFAIMNGSQNLDGVYYLSRSSEKTNFTIWEDIARFEWFNETAFNEELKLLYEDFTVESGVKYKYAIQK